MPSQKLLPLLLQSNLWGERWSSICGSWQLATACKLDNSIFTVWIRSLFSDFQFRTFSNSLLFIFQFLNLLNLLFPNFLIFNLLGSPPHYFLIFNIFSSPTRYFLISNFLNSVTHQWAAKGRQRSRWKGRFFTSMCNLYSCTDHWKEK